MQIEWTEVNLPFSQSGEGAVRPEAPNLDAEMVAEFGKTWDETEEVNAWPVAKVYRAEMNALIQQDDLESDDDPYDTLPEAWLQSGDPEKVAFANNVQIRRKMRIWEHNHPVLLAHSEACEAARLAGSFAGLGLVRPGVQIEMADGKQYLIGDINRLRGVCDDCTAFEPEDIVVRYRVLVAAEDL